MRIAILEDDALQLELIGTWLRSIGHSCRGLATAAAFRKAIGRETYDLFILDWNLPDGSGLDVVRWLRDTLHSDRPILVATARDDENDLVAALNAGADDYLTKPLRQKETIARVTALIRRSQPVPTDTGPEADPFRFDMTRRRIFLYDDEVLLTGKEFALALYLFGNAGRLLSRTHLLETVWEKHGALTTRTVDTHVSRLRNKLGLGEAVGWRLISVYQVGYRLERTGEREM